MAYPGSLKRGYSVYACVSRISALAYSKADEDVEDAALFLHFPDC